MMTDEQKKQKFLEHWLRYQELVPSLRSDKRFYRLLYDVAEWFYEAGAADGGTSWVDLLMKGEAVRERAMLELALGTTLDKVGKDAGAARATVPCEFCGGTDDVQMEMIGPTTAASCATCRQIPPAGRERYT